MRRRVLLLAAVAALALTGCGHGTARPAPSASGQPGPGRIVSLSPTATEMLFAIGAGRQVVAVDELSNYPAEAPKTDLSGFKPNAEAIAGKNPDLVVLSNDTNTIVDQLGQLKIPVYLAPAAKTLDDTYAQLTELGRLTGHAAQAADVVRHMRDDIAGLVAKSSARPSKLTYYWELDPTYYSVTSKTFIGSLLAMVGLVNIADPADASGAAGGYPPLSAEFVVKANPDLIFLADSKCCQQSAETVRARPGWAGVAAVRDGRVYALDDDVASRWGPRVVDLLRAVTDAVASA